MSRRVNGGNGRSTAIAYSFMNVGCRGWTGRSARQLSLLASVSSWPEEPDDLGFRLVKKLPFECGDPHTALRLARSSNCTNSLEIRGRNLLQRSDLQEAEETQQGLTGISGQLLDSRDLVGADQLAAAARPRRARVLRASIPRFLSNSLTDSRDRGNKNAVVYPKIGTGGYFDHTGCLGMARLPFTIGGKSFTSSYTSVMKRSVLACVSP